MRNKISNFLVALLGFLFLICGSVVLTLNCRELYYRDMRNLQLSEELGLSETTIQANYDALIDYNLITKGIDTLEFPTFPMSDHGRIHFEEVKQIFVGIQYLLVITGILFLTGLIWKLCRKEYKCLKLLTVLTFVVPTVLGVLIGVCWDQVFVLFHKIFFNNDYWLFDPMTDPVILILPDAFFAHCAIAILGIIVLGGAFSLTVYLLLEGHKRKVRDNGRSTGRRSQTDGRNQSKRYTEKYNRCAYTKRRKPKDGEMEVIYEYRKDSTV